jgi:tripartite-type tricarboxylate transporter receptor subunit TctC
MEKKGDGSTALIRKLLVSVTASTILVLAPCPSIAQPSEPTLSGKTINLTIGFPPGTGNDIYARLIARHLGLKIPGQPTVVPRNMPGAGSYKAANYLYNSAPRDGTALGFISHTAPTEEVLGNSAIQFKTANFDWIGRVSSYTMVSVTWHTSKVRTIAEAQTTEASMGTTGAGSSTFIYPNVVNRVLDGKFKLVRGYEGNASVFLAMERGEIDGATTGWFTIKSTKKEWLDGKKVNILVQHMAERHPDLPNVPTLVELARNAEEKQLLRLFASEGVVGKSILAPPGLPASTLTMLRRAFDAMTRDPEFIADADKIQAELDPMPGEKLQAMIEAVAHTPPAIVDRARSLLK